MIEKSLKPVPTTKEAAPLKLLNLVSCNCKVACNNRCKCVQFGMHCSAMCGECQGANCENSVEIILEEPEYGAGKLCNNMLENVCSTFDIHRKIYY